MSLQAEIASSEANRNSSIKQTIACNTNNQRNLHKSYCNENNLRLVRLLTTNPAAGLPAIFSPSGKYEQRRIRPREHRITPVQQGFYPIPHFQEQFLVGLPVLPEKNYPGLYASDEEMQHKGSCLDEQGLFDLHSILPMDCTMRFVLTELPTHSIKNVI